jgi:hypothetical protein
VRADLLLANRSDTWTYQVLHALQDFLAPQQYLDAIWFRESINLKQLAHFAQTYHWGLERAWQLNTTWDSPIPAELWGLITHILVCLWGLLLAGGMIEKEITSSLCYLLPSLGYFQQSPPCTFLPSPFWP